MNKTKALQEVLSYFSESDLVKYEYLNLIHYFKFYKHTDDYFCVEFKYSKYFDDGSGWFELEDSRFKLNKFEIMILEELVYQHKINNSYI